MLTFRADPPHGPPPSHLLTTCGNDCKYKRELTEVRRLLAPHIAVLQTTTDAEVATTTALTEALRQASRTDAILVSLDEIKTWNHRLRPLLESLERLVYP